MEINSVYCCPCDEDIFARLMKDAAINVDKKKAPSQAIYVDGDGIIFHIKLNKETREAVMRPTGSILMNGKITKFPIASILMHLKQKQNNKKDTIQ